MRASKIWSSFICILVFMLLGCNSAPPQNDTKKLSDLEKIVGVKFPPDAKIIHSEKSERNKELAYHHIIHSKSPVKFNKPAVTSIPSESTIEILKRYTKSRDLGKLKDSQTQCYEGTIGKGSWGAFQTNFESGSYLRIEQIFLSHQR